MTAKRTLRLPRRVPPRPSGGDFALMDQRIVAWWLVAGLLKATGQRPNAQYPSVEPVRLMGAEVPHPHDLPVERRHPVVSSASFGEPHSVAADVPPSEVEEFEDPPPPDQVATPGRFLSAWRRFTSVSKDSRPPT